jgi:isopentenyldiphosphate isomerase
MKSTLTCQDMRNPEEYLEIVNEKGEVKGIAPRSRLHGNPSLIHRVMHVLVFNREGDILLQKRSLSKDVAPGMWDTSVGGHILPGEDGMTAAKREMEEELGITACELAYLYSYIHRDPRETELVITYHCIYSGDICFSRDEIDQVRFWSLDEIKQVIGKNILSCHFEDEFKTYLSRQTPRRSGP